MIVNLMIGTGAFLIIIGGALLIRAGLNIGRQQQHQADVDDITRITGAWAIQPSPLATDNDIVRGRLMRAWYRLMEDTVPRTPSEYATGESYQPKHAPRDHWTEYDRQTVNTSTGTFPFVYT